MNISTVHVMSTLHISDLTFILEDGREGGGVRQDLC